MKTHSTPYISIPVTLLAVAVIALAAAMGACSDKKAEGKPVVGQPVSVDRLDLVLAQYARADSAGRARLLDDHRDALTALAQVWNGDGGADAVATDSMVLAMAQSDAVRMFVPHTSAVFPDLDTFARAYGTALARADSAGLQLPLRHYAAVVWGRPESIVFNGDYALIALNHYLGADHEVYAGWPEYMRSLKRPDMMAYDMLEAQLATAYPYDPGDGEPTLLSRMLYDGALGYIKQHLVPGGDLGHALGFVTPGQVDDLAKNEQFMYSSLIANKYLWSTDPTLIDAMLSPAPSVPQISPDAPGRAPRYTGWRIVDSYMRAHPDTKLTTLLSAQAPAMLMKK